MTCQFYGCISDKLVHVKLFDDDAWVSTKLCDKHMPPTFNISQFYARRSPGVGPCIESGKFDCQDDSYKLMWSANGKEYCARCISKHMDAVELDRMSWTRQRCETVHEYLRKTKYLRDVIKLAERQIEIAQNQMSAFK